MAKTWFFLPAQLHGALQAGGKAYNLKKLQEGQFAVPPFFAISADCYKEVFEADDQAVWDAFEKNLFEFIEAHFPQTRSFSVRSSAVGEDSEVLSYAGQFESVLHVKREELLPAIRLCWQAANRAVYGNKRNKLPMGLVVQEMLVPDCSGVAFSANPQGIWNEAVVVVGDSTGDNVVEDKAPVTTYYYHLTDRCFYYEQQPCAPLLEQSLLETLVSDLSLLAESGPVDVEFAVKEDKLWYLQQRPITTLSDKQLVILDNSNIVESYPGLSLPLTASFVQYVYYSVFYGLARRCLPGKDLLRQYDATLQHMVADANGRMYYQISNWYEILQLLPFQKKIIPVWQKMLGVDNKSYSEKAYQLSVLQQLNVYRKLITSIVGIPRKMRRLEGEYKAVDREFKLDFHTGMTNQELAGLYDRIAARLLKNWDITLLNDLYAFVYTALLERQMRKAGYTDYKEKSNAYLSGISEMESMKPVQSMIRLAKTVAESPKLREKLEGLTDDKKTDTYLNSGDDFAAAVKAHILQYGERCLEELKLETRTFRSNPLLFIRLLLDYADSMEDLDRVLARPAAKVQMELQRCPGRGRIRYFSKKAMLGISNRETSRMNRGRIFGMVRAIFLQMGENLVQAQILQEKWDVFYLTKEELFAYTQNKTDGENFMALIRQRKLDYDAFAKVPDYSRLVFTDKIIHKYPGQAGYSQKNTPGCLSGTPCSGGVAEGEVLIISDPKQAGDVSGKIIVAKSTDPGWVFLLARAKGIIAEKGSLLSHTAIISRELKIPSIVGVAGITGSLKSHSRIRMDGNSGKIEVLRYE